MSKKLQRDIVNTGAAYFAASIIAIAAGILFPRLLGPDEWGLWSIMLGVIGILGPFAQVAMSTTLVTYISKHRHDNEKISYFVNSAYFVAVLLSFVVSVALILLSGYLAGSVFQDGRLKTLFLLGAAIIFFEQLNIINRDFFRGFKNFRIYNLLEVLPVASIFVISMVLLYFFSFRAIYLAAARLTVLSVACVVVLIYIKRHAKNLSIFKMPRRKETSVLLKFGVPLIFTMTFMTIMKSMDRVMIGYFLETSNVGIYSVAAGMPLMIGGMFAPISIVLLPTFSERRSKGESSELLLKEVFSFLLFVSIPLIIFIILFSRNILQIVFGEEYILGAVVLSLTSVEIFLFGGIRLLGASVVASERTTKYALGMGIAAVSNISMNIIFIPVWGIEGAALATVLSFLILFFFILALSKRDHKTNLLRSDLKAVLFLTIGMISSGILLKRYLPEMVSFITTAIVFTLILLMVLQYTAPRWYGELKTYVKDIFL